MRRHEQLSLTQPWIAHAHAQELEAMSRILDEEPGRAERVGQDLVRGVKNPQTGRAGMSGDQVLWVLLVKQMNGFSYETLHFHLLDSASALPAEFSESGKNERGPCANQGPLSSAVHAMLVSPCIG